MAENNEKVNQTEEPAVEEQNELLEAQKKAEELNDRLLRTMAEYDNYRKRTQKEKESIYPDAISFAVQTMLPVIDNFEFALNSECTDENFKKGMEMIYGQMLESLKTLNVSEINPIGNPFDPEEHNAVMHVEDDTVEENTVVEVLRKGYKLGDRVIRFAMVKVAN